MSSDQIGKLFYVYLFYGNMIQFTNKSSDESWLILRLRLFTKKNGSLRICQVTKSLLILRLRLFT